MTPAPLALALPALLSLAVLAAAVAALRAARRLVDPPATRPRLHLLPGGGAPRPTRPTPGPAVHRA